jgi:hypothetical protein
VDEHEIDMGNLLVPGRALVLVSRSGPPLRIRGQLYIVDRDFLTVTITDASGSAPETDTVLGAAVFAARGVYRFVTTVVLYRPGRPSPLVLTPPESFEWIDRRVAPRVAVALPVTCVPVVSTQRSRAEAAGFPATTVDISLGGVALATEHPVAPGTELRVAFLLPRGDSITARGTVVTVQPPAPGHSTAVAHLQVDEIDGRHRERLGAFVHEAQFLSAGEPATDAILRQPLVGTAARSA